MDSTAFSTIMQSINSLGQRLASLESAVNNTCHGNNNMPQGQKPGFRSKAKAKTRGKPNSTATKGNKGPSTWTRSTNSDFSAVYRLIISLVRVGFCVSQREEHEILARVGADIGRVFESVSLPGDSDTVKSFMQEAAAKSLQILKDTVDRYLTKAKDQLLDRTERLNPQDSEQAITVAMACIRKRHGAIKPDVASALINELRPHIGSRFIATIQPAALPVGAISTKPAQQSPAVHSQNPTDFFKALIAPRDSSNSQPAGLDLGPKPAKPQHPPGLASQDMSASSLTKSASKSDLDTSQQTSAPKDKAKPEALKAVSTTASNSKESVMKEFNSIPHIANLRIDKWETLPDVEKIQYNNERQGRKIVPIPTAQLSFGTLKQIYLSMDQTQLHERSDGRKGSYAYKAARFHRQNAKVAMLSKYRDEALDFLDGSPSRSDSDPDSDQD